MKNHFLLLILSLFIFQVSSSNAQEDLQSEEDLIFCTLKHNPDIKAKLTKTNDQLYSFYAMNPNFPDMKDWSKIMDLNEPVVWSKDGIGEIADFYSTFSYSYWLRLNFTSNSFISTGSGEFIMPQSEEELKNKAPAETFQLIECSGTLK